jgi:hypothetical protein
MKRILSLFLALVMCFSFSAAAFADAPAYDKGSGWSDEAPQDSSRTEETMWVYAVWGGNRYMRLWSITYGKWLTDWIYVGPA